MQIKRISEKITSVFSQNKANVANHTNPFASFRGNIITADVFEKAKKVSIFNLNQDVFQREIFPVEKVTSSFHRVSDKISAQWNSVVNFGRNIGQHSRSAFDFLKNSKIVFDFSNPKNFVSLDLSNNTYSVKNLMKRNVSELNDEFVNLLAKRGV